ncbi:MAG: ribonuclease III domain-containing protein [Clostridiaceae bacterium]
MENLLYEKFSSQKARCLNPLQLAFVGDGVFEAFIRNYILSKNSELTAHKLHVEAIKYVKAHAQSEIIKRIEKDLSEEEYYIYKRGRNTKSATVPKNADLAEYRAATGFEALVGYLYLTDNRERLNYILLKSVQEINL